MTHGGLARNRKKDGCCAMSASVLAMKAEYRGGEKVGAPGAAIAAYIGINREEGPEFAPFRLDGGPQPKIPLPDREGNFEPSNRRRSPKEKRAAPLLGSPFLSAGRHGSKFP